MKIWAGLTKSASVHILYLSQKNGGLNVPSLSLTYKRLQVSKVCQQDCREGLVKWYHHCWEKLPFQKGGLLSDMEVFPNSGGTGSAIK